MSLDIGQRRQWPCKTDAGASFRRETILGFDDDLRDVFEAVAVAIHLLAADGTILMANRAELALLGWPRSEYVGRNIREFHADPEEAMDLMSRVAAGQAVTERELQLRRHDGTTFRAAVTARARRHQGEIVGVWVSTRPLPGPSAPDSPAEVDLRTIERVASEWTRAVDALDQAVLVVDEHGLIRRLNRAAMQGLGASAYQDVLARSFESMATAPPWSAAIELLRRADTAGAPLTLQVRDAEGRIWDVAVGTGEQEPRGREWRVVTASDVTELVKLQEAVRHNERMAAIGSLMSGVAHEARTPLFGITATLDAFEKTLAAVPEYRQFSTLLRSNCERLAALMRDLLEYGRPLEPHFVPGILADVVEGAIRSCAHLAEQRHVDVACRVSRALPLVPMEKPRLVQVFQNILSNALNLSERGTVVRISARAALEAVVCAIEDAGPGFAPEDLPRAFEPFFSKRADGTGLGLSIAQRIVEAHHGRIEAANRPEGGAVVRVYLPHAGPMRPR